MLGFYATGSRAISEGPATSLATISITLGVTEAADTASSTVVVTPLSGSGGTGTCTIDFGAFPGSNEASIAITGISAISSTSKAEAFVMGDSSTADHSASDHRYFSLFAGLTCGTPTTATGFTVYARSQEKLQGTFLLNYVWAD